MVLISPDAFSYSFWMAKKVVSEERTWYFKEILSISYFLFTSRYFMSLTNIKDTFIQTWLQNIMHCKHLTVKYVAYLLTSLNYNVLFAGPHDIEIDKSWLDCFWKWCNHFCIHILFLIIYKLVGPLSCNSCLFNKMYACSTSDSKSMTLSSFYIFMN